MSTLVTCPLCDGGRSIDSGGVTPEGDPIDVTCPACDGAGEAALPVQCAWCLVWLEEGSPGLRELRHVSHGICGPCAEELRKEALSDPDACAWGVAEDCTGRAIHPHGACAACKTVCELMADQLGGEAA